MNNLPAVMGAVKTRERVLEEIRWNPGTYSKFKKLDEEFQEKLIEFCMGIRGVKMTYDSFFKFIFDAEVHPERLGDFLSAVLGRSLKIKRALRNEHRKISEKRSLILTDIIVEFESGELADVEIQKYGYLFGGERASCYSSDMVMRQYERVKSSRGEDFIYKDLKKVYIIVIMENSSREFKKLLKYVHKGEWKFDTGLKLNLLQEFYFIPLDIFFQIKDNKRKTIRSELEAWLYFIGSDKPEDIRRVLQKFPKFEEMYREVSVFRYHPEEAVEMFSDALKKLDENTVNYMIEMLKEELLKMGSALKEKDSALEEKNNALEEKDSIIEAREHALEKKDREIEVRDNIIKRMEREIAELRNV